VAAIFRLTIMFLVFLGVVAACSMGALQETRMSDPQTGVTVSIGSAWFGQGRILKITDLAGERVQFELIGEWGPTLRTNIYRTPNGELGIIDFQGAWKVVRNPLDLDLAKPSAVWEYLGTLIEDSFRDAGQQPECMDILMDEPPPPHRSWIYRQSCE